VYRLLISGGLYLDDPLVGYSPSSRLRRRQESISLLNEIGKEAISLNVNGLIFSGDLFYRPFPSPQVFKALVELVVNLEEKGIPVLFLEGENDEGLFYRQHIGGLPTVAMGEHKELLPGLNVSVGDSIPEDGGIVRWKGNETPSEIPNGVLLLTSGQSYERSNQGVFKLGNAIQRDFDGSNSSCACIIWDQGPGEDSIVPLSDRTFNTVTWDIDQQGEDIVPLLDEQKGIDVYLRVIIKGNITEPLPLSQWRQTFAASYFYLVLDDQTDLSLNKEASPLIDNAFSQRIAQEIERMDKSEKELKVLRRAWVLGQEALKGGKKRAN
jgi:hypothetical protein